MTESILSIQNLTKKYGSFAALEHLTIELSTGVYGLLGPNGAGKTTFLNLLTDNLERTEGSILYRGTEIKKLGAKYRRHIGYTPQVQGMYEDFTARDFLHYIGALKGMKGKEIRRQTEEFLEVVSLGNEAHHRLGTFSGGMRQRVLLAAAMLDEPDILILDEPTVGLDPKERIRLRNYLASVARTRTVLLATHVVDDIESIAGKVILLKNGRLCGFDSPSQLISRLKGHVGVFRGTYDVIMQYKKDYPNGKVLQMEDDFALRIVAKELPKACTGVDSGLTLEDVYLYYAAEEGAITDG